MEALFYQNSLEFFHKGVYMIKQTIPLNKKGFSKIEVFLICTILIIFMTIIFVALHTTVIKFKIKSDYQRAKEVEGAIKLLISQTGISNITSLGLLRELPNSNPFEIKDNEKGVMLLIEKLQKTIYIRDPRTGSWRSHGPFLKNPRSDGQVSYQNYSPQWTEHNGGHHIGYHIEIWSSSQDVKVTPTEYHYEFKITIH
jgi:hypothetical protein